MEKSTLKMTGSKSLGDTGFLQFLGLFQVIMANPGGPIEEDMHPCSFTFRPPGSGGSDDS